MSDLVDNAPVKVIAGFPEIVHYNQRCKLCKLSSGDDHAIARLVHDLKFYEADSLRAFEARVAKVMARHGLDPISRRAMGRHFEEHVDTSKAIHEIANIFEVARDESEQSVIMAYASGSTSPQELALEIDNDEQAIRGDSEEGALGKNDSDYHQMWDLFARLRRRITAIDADPTAFMSADGGANGYKIVMWAKLISEARQLLVALNNMRNNDRLVLSILEAHTKRFASGVVDPLGAELRDFVESFNEVGQGDKAVETWERQDLEAFVRRAQGLVVELSEFMREGLVDIFKTAAADSLQQSRDEFKLH